MVGVERRLGVFLSVLLVATLWDWVLALSWRLLCVVVLPTSDLDDLRPYITCDALDDVSGKKNVTLSIAFQTTFITMQNSKVFSQCLAGYFGYNGLNGTKGEYCDPYVPSLAWLWHVSVSFVSSSA